MQKHKLKRGCVQITYRNFSVSVTKQVALLCILAVVGIVGIAVFAIKQSATANHEIELLKSQIVSQKNINESLTQTIQQYHKNIEEIANTLSDTPQKSKALYSTRIESRLQLYGILLDIQKNLEIINVNIDKKIKRVRRVMNMVKLVNSPSITRGLEKLNIAYSTPINQHSQSIQPASKVLGINLNLDIAKTAEKIILKKQGMEIILKTITKIPLQKPVRDGRLVSRFGIRFHPIHHRHKMHNGIDFVGKKGTKVLATADGVIERAVYSPSYGNFVVIQHANNIKTLYAHMSNLKVRAGQAVIVGQAIGIQGNTGTSTGEHIHYEVIVNNRHHNPLKFLQAKSILEETV